MYNDRILNHLVASQSRESRRTANTMFVEIRSFSPVIKEMESREKLISIAKR